MRPWLDPALSFARWRDAAVLQLEQHLAACTQLQQPEGLQRIMQYAVLAEGKRLRPLLVLASYQCAQAALSTAAFAPHAQQDVGAGDALVWNAACAVELIHAYSLVHDDMPCMDNDMLRRGKPTVHAAFGQANALLAGDALHALAFAILVQGHHHPNTDADAVAAAQVPVTVLQRQVQLIRLLGLAAGAQGMAGGQFLDLQAVGQTLDEQQLRHMHALKTGALIAASVRMGAVCAQGIRAAPQVQRGLGTFGQHLGLLYQVVDDILDATQDSATLGKTAGKDAAQNKPTYVTALGLAGAQAIAAALFTQAQTALGRVTQLGRDTNRLQAMLHWVAQRAH